ncbi:hypothetical protein HPB49_019739 [Dermacentor silvarum]|uniref:Uncharacterized protein n=1 Tax=Dermacentor silvarum TaxID=543639 RepID=A0ACB8E2P7_DERSI|nr:hypothetical protein HPB49_019739 [Dermacentor silvarum]
MEKRLEVSKEGSKMRASHATPARQSSVSRRPGYNAAPPVGPRTWSGPGVGGAKDTPRPGARARVRHFLAARKGARFPSAPSSAEDARQQLIGGVVRNHLGRPTDPDQTCPLPGRGGGRRLAARVPSSASGSFGTDAPPRRRARTDARAPPTPTGYLPAWGPRPPPHLWITEPPQRWIVRRSRTPTVVCVCACSAGHDNHLQATAFPREANSVTVELSKLLYLEEEARDVTLA